MSNKSIRSRIEFVKNILKEIHRGTSLSQIKEKYKDELSKITPLEILMAEQELLREGIEIQEILSLCDLHVELFRESLRGRELQGLVKGHPLDLLIRENEWIFKKAEVLGLYARMLLNTFNEDEAVRLAKEITQMLIDLKKIRTHYRKVQMLIFPYLERMGIIAIPRVMWGREDNVLVKLRSLYTEIQRDTSLSISKLHEFAKNVAVLSRDIGELVFRENKILYPAVYVLFPEGAWVAISEIADEIGYIVEIDQVEWRSDAKPIYPYEWEPSIDREQIEKLPVEFKQLLSQVINVDNYRVRRVGDIEFDTGFLNPDEIEGIFKHLPLELTYADVNDRVRFYTESELVKGFVRTKTIIGRRIPYCHPPRLEKYVMTNVEAIKQGKFKYREFWTMLGDKIMRVIITPVKNKDGELLGVLEIVEDLTDVVNNPEEVKKKIMVL
uniref:DUF438 domain-containing protein n=1 Tax=Staphylothermus marinus TaxID=2280 RepID=A0A7C4D7N0_STAMA